MWRPSTCGTVSINYPFYLYDKTAVLRGNDGSFCGYPGLAIRCEDNKQVVLQLGDDNYTVSNIDYTNKIFYLADQELSKDESCPRVDHNVTLPSSSWLSFPDNRVDCLFFFLDCSFGSVRPRPIDISPIRCGSFGEQTAVESFVLPGNEAPPPEMFLACPLVIQVPVLKLPEGPRNDSRWINGGYGDVLSGGFRLGWEQRKPRACQQCEDSYGRCGYNKAGEFTGCLCSGERVEAQNCTTGASPPSTTSGHPNRTKIYIAVSTSCLLLLCLIILMFYLTCKYGSVLSKAKDAPSIESFIQKNRNIHPKRYTYAEVKKMTKSFDVKLGQGGFGAVYRGNLPNGHEVAVKMLKDNKGDGEEFMNEVASISRTSHVNVVTLLGFCLQGSKRALIYEYMPKGSLERYAFNRNLDNESTLTWEKLFEIAIGIARGLEYLHRGCNTRIVHFDIKPHNILLDQDFCPKISDFGMAKLCLNKESAISMVGARGTIGYIAPEVYSKQFGTISSKSDVYSYGMMVLEMVGAREMNNTNTNSESSSQYFPQWIYEHLDDYCISASEINGETTELVRKMIVVGLWCIQVTPTTRPTMTRVVEMLEGSTSTLELPPRVLLS
ncbi:hypothetical protein QOZ80_1BG0079410 [Eleusine coracana subsp. coracana]|nr:hypothetical protein QOZ80_1BG0079410 [Eleusine coracana subsp. coracana]